jgi:hypothetical protein
VSTPPTASEPSARADHHRVATSPDEPSPSGRPGAQRWIGYLDWVREDIIRAVLALPEADRRGSRLPSGWSPIELLAHVGHMEQRWFVWGFLGESVDHPWGDWDGGEPAGGADPDSGRRWAVPAGTSADDLASRCRAMGERTRMVLSENAIDTSAAVGGRFAADPPTLEWICFHVLAEYARHAGHLDIVVELAAGATHP